MSDRSLKIHGKLRRGDFIEVIQ